MLIVCEPVIRTFSRAPHHFYQMYELLFTEKATKSLKKLPKSDAKRILIKLDELAANPNEVPNVKQLSNHLIAGFR